MRYETPDGNVIVGETATEIVSGLREEKFEPGHRDLAAYRRATANRAKDLYGAEIDYTSDETFLETLTEAKLIRPLD